LCAELSVNLFRTARASRVERGAASARGRLDNGGEGDHAQSSDGSTYATDATSVGRKKKAGCSITFCTSTVTGMAAHSGTSVYSPGGVGGSKCEQIDNGGELGVVYAGLFSAGE